MKIVTQIRSQGRKGDNHTSANYTLDEQALTSSAEIRIDTIRKAYGMWTNGRGLRYEHALERFLDGARVYLSSRAKLA